MMLLSSIIQTFEADFLATYQNALPSQRKALTAWQFYQLRCLDCGTQTTL